MNKKIEVVKICAVGCNKSFATLKVKDKEYGVFISRDLYYCLKELGVPTSQSLRSKKND